MNPSHTSRITPWNSSWKLFRATLCPSRISTLSAHRPEEAKDGLVYHPPPFACVVQLEASQLPYCNFGDEPLAMEVLQQTSNPLILLRRHPSECAQMMDSRCRIVSQAPLVKFAQDNEGHELIAPESSPTSPLWSVRSHRRHPESRPPVNNRGSRPCDGA